MDLITIIPKQLLTKNSKDILSKHASKRNPNWKKRLLGITAQKKTQRCLKWSDLFFFFLPFRIQKWKNLGKGIPADLVQPVWDHSQSSLTSEISVLEQKHTEEMLRLFFQAMIKRITNQFFILTTNTSSSFVTGFNCNSK